MEGGKWGFLKNVLARAIIKHRNSRSHNFPFPLPITRRESVRHLEEEKSEQKDLNLESLLSISRLARGLSPLPPCGMYIGARKVVLRGNGLKSFTSLQVPHITAIFLPRSPE